MSGSYRLRGNSLPETAMVLGLTLALIFAIMDFGRALYSYESIANMAREGARWAMVRGASCALSGEVGEAACPAATSDIQTYVKGLAAAVIDPTQVTVNTTASAVWPGGSGCSTPCNQPGYPVVVQVSYTFSFVLPFMPNTSIPMSSTSTMIISQ